MSKVCCCLLLVLACGGDDSGAAEGDGGSGADAPGSDMEPAALTGITAAHNEARALDGVAALAWDADLAAIAQAWADSCTNVDGFPQIIDHNPGRGDSYPGSVGENIYASGGTATGPDAVEAWMDEKPFYDYGSNSCSGSPSGGCGHYTQVVWAASTKLGCGISNCPGVTFPNSVVCDYSPAGNDGSRPF